MWLNRDNIKEACLDLYAIIISKNEKMKFLFISFICGCLIHSSS